jgi:hypothetical protein
MRSWQWCQDLSARSHLPVRTLWRRQSSVYSSAYLGCRRRALSTLTTASPPLAETTSSIRTVGGCRCGACSRISLPVPSDVFVDLGSGKGQALLIAGRLPYRRVVGVEIDEEFSQCAKRNVERARPRLRVQEVNVVTANVLEWPIPDDASVVFMFNPFVGQTFCRPDLRIL